jgi:hypothetical protein
MSNEFLSNNPPWQTAKLGEIFIGQNSILKLSDVHCKMCLTIFSIILFTQFPMN